MKDGKYPTWKRCSRGFGRNNRFGVADLTQGFYQMPLHENCRAPTSFICFWGVYEWTQVPMGLLPSANFPPKSMSFCVLRELQYQICEFYINELLVYGHDDDDFVQMSEQIYEMWIKDNHTQHKKNISGFRYSTLSGAVWSQNQPTQHLTKSWFYSARMHPTGADQRKPWMVACIIRCRQNHTTLDTTLSPRDIKG